MTGSPLADLLSRKRLLIFDFDGTIVDSSPLHAQAFSEAFAAYGTHVDYSAIAGLVTADAVDKVAAGARLILDETQRSALIADKKARARALIASRLEPIAGSIPFLRRAARSHKLALCTSGSRGTVEVALERVGLADRFAPVVTADDVTHGKPHPEGFLKALAAHGMDAEGALIFEDAPSGLAAAAAAGIEAVHVVGPGQAEDPLQADWAMLGAALAEARP